MGRWRREHLEAEPAGLPVVAAEILPFDRPNFQVALDVYLAAEDRRSELVGLSVMQGYRMGIAELARAGSTNGPPVPNPGSVEYESVAIGSREVLCVKSGVWLISDGGHRLAVMLKQTDHGPTGEMLSLEVMATEREVADGAVSELAERAGRSEARTEPRPGQQLLPWRVVHGCERLQRRRLVQP
jgi:hypothetical protein